MIKIVITNTIVIYEVEKRICGILNMIVPSKKSSNRAARYCKVYYTLKSPNFITFSLKN